VETSRFPFPDSTRKLGQVPIEMKVLTHSDSAICGDKWCEPTEPIRLQTVGEGGRLRNQKVKSGWSRWKNNKLYKWAHVNQGQGWPWGRVSTDRRSETFSSYWCSCISAVRTNCHFSSWKGPRIGPAIKLLVDPTRNGSMLGYGIFDKRGGNSVISLSEGTFQLLQALDQELMCLCL
jgi:hypothetical protein